MWLVPVQREPNLVFIVFLENLSSRAIVQPGCPAKRESGTAEGSAAFRILIVLIFPVRKRSFYWCLTLPKSPVFWMLSSFH